jgi:hypothetical protein
MARILEWLFPPQRRHALTDEDERRRREAEVAELERLAYLEAVRNIRSHRSGQ